MKKILSLFLALLFAQCNFIDPGLKQDPNRPVKVPMAQLLPVVQVTLAFQQGGILSRYTTTWMQQTASLNRPVIPIDHYRTLNADMDTLWNAYYMDILTDLREIRRQAGSDSPHYSGIAKVLEVLTVTQLVDMWSDIPYSDALQGAAQLQPVYDEGQEVYQALHQLLDEALDDLAAPVSVFKPWAEDLVYGGDLSAWTGLARLCKARLYLHRSQYGDVLQVLDAGGLGSNDQNAMVYFGTEPNEQNPWYQYGFQRGDIGMCATLVDLMKELEDPRLPAFATLDDTLGYSGNLPGKEFYSGISFPGPLYASAGSPVPLALYPEQKFIEAEAALDTDPGRAAAAFNEAVAASLEMFGVDEPAYLQANASETAATISLEKIMTQKHMALYTMPEIFSDWRRTGLPELTPVEGFDQIARRFPYPSQEQQLNAANCPDGITVFDRVFWDN
jgi:hypothetical protein